jgi:uncharacterized protein YaaQ
MKLILAIIQDSVHEKVSSSLISEGFRVTCIASTGGFWKKGNKTLLIGLEDEEVEKALELIRSSCSEKNEPDLQRTIIFVLNVNNTLRF